MNLTPGEAEAGIAPLQGLPPTASPAQNSQSRSQSSSGDLEISKEHIEDYPQGYPQYSALIASDEALLVCRRFSRLRSRLLLTKQDELTRLESRLDLLDRDEKAVLSLGSIRFDSNADRKKTLEDIDKALSEYDAMLERYHRALSYRAAERRQVLSLQHWVSNNASLARNDTAYLTKFDDLLCVSPMHDSSSHSIEMWVEERLVKLCSIFKKYFRRDISRDAAVYMFSVSAIRKISRIIVALLTIAFLIAPALICNFITRQSVRLAVVGCSVFLFVVLLSSIVKVKAVEILVAGTTYATVLIVYISGNDIGEGS